MIIIVEGIDGSGKSTLTETLALRLSCQTHHEGPPPKEGSVLDHYGHLLQDARSKQHVVFDRLALGERIYGPVMRNEDRLGADGWRIFQRLVMASGARQVLCQPKYETCLANWSSGRPEYISRVTQFKDVYDRYLEMSVPGQIVYDYERDSLDDLIAKLHVPRKTLPLNMVGSPDATYLFVGERGSGAFDLPFFGMSHSSGYLNRALELAGFDERDMTFMNAFSLAGRENMIPVFPRVIALGKEAGIVCDDQGVDHHQVPHPQYFARFHHADVTGYATLLRNCVVTQCT
jgi:hypothetical protein